MDLGDNKHILIQLGEPGRPANRGISVVDVTSMTPLFGGGVWLTCQSNEIWKLDLSSKELTTDSWYDYSTSTGRCKCHSGAKLRINLTEKKFEEVDKWDFNACN